jgi:hypothetical protein
VDRTGGWRTWVWTFVGVQIVGVVVDAIWHGLMHPDFEPRTLAETVRHLATVHLVLYLGVLGLCVVTAWALFGRSRRPGAGIALPHAFAGAMLQLVGEVWHAAVHLALRPSPFPELIGFVGLAVVIGATIVAGRRARGAADARRLDHGAARHQPRG